MLQLDLPSGAEKPPTRLHVGRREPALRIARVVLLRAPRLAEDTIIRDIHLRPGLNILWARNARSPIAPESPPALLSGHSAGKTTFCRLIRYLLGEPRFGTRWLQDQIRTRFPEGWVVGEVVVGGAIWAVGRPFARHVHPFAARGAELATVLGTNEGYQGFLDALLTAVVTPLKVSVLPHSGVPIDWLHVLPWLARDQEARFGGVVEWRAAPSESDGPNPPAADRYVVARALLDVMPAEEVLLERERIEIVAAKETLDGDAAGLELRADENRKQLKERLGLLGVEGNTDPLSMHALRADVERRRKELTLKVAALGELRADGQRADRARMAAHERMGDAREQHGRALQAVEEKRKLAGALATVAAKSQLEDFPARPGRCNAKAADAKESGCPLFVEAPIGLNAHRGQAQAKQEAELARRELDELETRAVELSRGVTEAKAHEALLYKDALRGNTAVIEEERRVAGAQQELDEIERRLASLDQAFEWVRRKREEQTAKGRELERVREQNRAIRKSPAAALGRLSSHFAEAVRALLGPGVDGRVELAREGDMVARIVGRREQRGAAMDTVSVLAFDLAALTLGIEGHASFPGFLMHDGPREADLDLPIYAQLFRYAVQLEQAFDGDPGFQYIVTTTTPPPDELQEPGRWLLEPELDASVREGRLLKEDL